MIVQNNHENHLHFTLKSYAVASAVEDEAKNREGKRQKLRSMRALQKGNRQITPSSQRNDP